MRVCLLFLEELTTDSVEVCCQLLTECGQVLQELNKKAMMILTSRLRKILHEGMRDSEGVVQCIFERSVVGCYVFTCTLKIRRVLEVIW